MAFDGVGRHLAALFEGAAAAAGSVGSPERKKAKGSEAAGSAGPSVTIGPSPFAPEQSQWLQAALGAALSSFGQVVDSRCVKIEEKQEKMEEKQSAMDASIAELRAKQEEFEKKALSQNSQASSVGRGAASTPRGSADGDALPRERIHAVIGGLGWDTQDLVLLTRAKSALQEAGIDAGAWTAMSPMCRPGGCGSMVELHFDEQRNLELARCKLRSQVVKCEGAQTVVWLDMKKTQQERRPGRLLKMLHVLALESCAKKHDGFEAKLLTFDQRTRSLSIGGARVAWISRMQSVEFASAGSAWFDDEEQERLASMVEAGL